MKFLHLKFGLIRGNFNKVYNGYGSEHLETIVGCIWRITPGAGELCHDHSIALAPSI